MSAGRTPEGVPAFLVGHRADRRRNDQTGGMLDDALARLNSQLPLVGRQRELPSGHAQVHRLILRWFAERGRPPATSDLVAAGANDLDEALDRLAADDLIVRVNGEIVGAYPFTTDLTPHHLTIEGRKLRAMCALDAVAVAPVFGLNVRIDSVCAVTGNPVHVEQEHGSVLAHQPADLRVGIRWSQPVGNAAHSMCREMVFLSDADTATAWRGTDRDSAGIFELEDAVEFGERFFGGLLDESHDLAE